MKFLKEIMARARERETFLRKETIDAVERGDWELVEFLMIRE